LDLLDLVLSTVSNINFIWCYGLVLKRTTVSKFSFNNLPHSQPKDFDLQTGGLFLVKSEFFYAAIPLSWATLIRGDDTIEGIAFGVCFDYDVSKWLALK
jgi:hypothetical protein